MRRNYSNTAVATTLAAGISDSDTSLTVADATGYPDPPFTITIGSEVILVGAKSGTTFSSLTRGYDGTTAAAHDSGAAVEHAVVAEDMRHAAAAVRTMLPAGGIGAVFGVWAGAAYAASMSANSTELANDTLFFVPLIVPGGIAGIDTLVIDVATEGSADGECRLGLYAADADDLPSILLKDFGVVPVTTTGAKQFHNPTPLKPGLYYLGLYLTGFTTIPKGWGPSGNAFGMAPLVRLSDKTGINNYFRNGGIKATATSQSNFSNFVDFWKCPAIKVFFYR